MAEKKLLNGTGLRSLETFYEPIMNADYGSVFAYRTQVRINDPDIGVILPGSYLPVAERSQLADKISLWAADDVCKTCSKLKSRGAFFEYLSFYVPSRLLLDADFLQQLLKILEQSGVLADDLCIEVPASVLYEDIALVGNALSALSQSGFHTMLSGFGKSTAFIGCLDLLNFDYILLDSSIVENLIADDDKKLSMAQSVFDLISAQGSEPIAAGVKNADIQSALPKCCTLFAGSRAGRVKRAASIR